MRDRNAIASAFFLPSYKKVLPSYQKIVAQKLGHDSWGRDVGLNELADGLHFVGASPV